MIGDRHDLADAPAAQAAAGVDQDGATYAGCSRDTGQGDHRSGPVTLVEVGPPAGHEDAPLSPILLSAHLPATSDDIRVEAVLMSRRDREHDPGQVGQAHTRSRLTPGRQGVSGTGPQDHQEVVAGHAGASGNLVGTFHGRARAFCARRHAQGLQTLRLESEACCLVVHERASWRATRPRPKARCPSTPMSRATSTPRLAPAQAPSRPPRGPSR